jgi:hypothetical protein
MKANKPAASAIEKLRFAATRRQFDRLPSSELPELAMFALEAGLDTPSLRELAGELHPTWADTGPLFERVLLDCGIATSPRLQAGNDLARHYAEQIISGAVTPYEGARHIWHDVAQQLWHNLEAVQPYLVFIGLASEWEDDEEHRPDYEQDIRDEAQKLLIRNA